MTPELANSMSWYQVGGAGTETCRYRGVNGLKVKMIDDGLLLVVFFALAYT